MRLRVYPPPFAHLHLQPFLRVLQQEAEKPGVLVCANALCAAGSLPPRIADQFDVLVGLLAVQAIERLLRQRQRQSESAQQPQRHGGHGLLPLQQQRFQRRQRCRPLVWPLQARPARRVIRQRQRRAFGADIELLAPVRLPARELRRRPVVTAKVRRMHHLHRQLVGFRQGEKLPRGVLQSRIQRAVYAVPTQIEKTDIAGRRAQIVEKGVPLARITVKLRKIQQRQRLQRRQMRHHAVPLLPRSRSGCHTDE